MTQRFVGKKRKLHQIWVKMSEWISKFFFVGGGLEMYNIYPLKN